MFLRTTADTGLNNAISRVLLAMQDSTPGTKEYAELISQLSKLNEIKVNRTKIHVSQDTLATIAAHIAGIVLILHYEKGGFIGTKALGFVQRLR